MTRAEEYRIEFNKLETMLKKRANARSEESISSVVSSLVNIHKDRVVRQFERDIRQFIELRNAIIHQSTDRAIAEPYEETVTRKVTVYEIEDMFNNAIKKGQRLLAVLVSDKGDASATPLGIITAWDLHKIDK